MSQPTREGSSKKERVRPLALRRWGLPLVLLVGLVGLAWGGLKVRGYLLRRVPLTAEWERAFAASDTSADGARVVRAGEATLAEVSPQTVLLRLNGSSNGDWFGTTTAVLDDLDGDGIPDLAVGAPQNENLGQRPAPHAPPGYVAVFSAADGTLLYTLRPTGSKIIDGADDHFGSAIQALDDLDGDGVGDIAVGAYLYDGDDGKPQTLDENTGGVFLFSGRDGSLLRMRSGVLWGDRFGFALDTLPDRDGDGLADLLVAHEKSEALAGIKNTGAIQIHSSASFEVLLRVEGPGWEGHLGSSLASMEDVDGDDVADFVGGAFMYAAHAKERAERGSGGLFSGARGELLRAWEGGAQGDHLGFSAAYLGDVDGDGIGDLALGAIQSGWVSDFWGPGYVVIKSGASGRELARVQGELHGEQFGWCLTPLSDRDGDGIGDLLVGAPAAITVLETLGVPGRLYLVSGRSGKILRAYQGLSADDQFGASASELSDLDGDGLPEILVGAPQNAVGQGQPGYAVVLAGALFDAR